MIFFVHPSKSTLTTKNMHQNSQNLHTFKLGISTTHLTDIKYLISSLNLLKLPFCIRITFIRVWMKLLCKLFGQMKQREVGTVRSIAEWKGNCLMIIWVYRGKDNSSMYQLDKHHGYIFDWYNKNADQMLTELLLNRVNADALSKCNGYRAIDGHYELW